MLVVRLEGEWGVNEVRRQLESQDNRNSLSEKWLSTRTLGLEECQYLCTSSRSVSFSKCARTL